MVSAGRPDMSSFAARDCDRVDLAQVPIFRLGRLTVAPAIRQISHDDGRRQILQHRVMQVLVALAAADGAIVTRDALVQSCWDGRVVGDDAVNRILSRLRAVSNEIGAGSFRIQTVTRIGYALLVHGSRDAGAPYAGGPVRPALRQTSRRVFLAAGSTATLGALAMFAWGGWRRGLAREATPADVQMLME